MLLVAAGPVSESRGKGTDLVHVNFVEKIENIKIFSARELTSPEEITKTGF